MTLANAITLSRFVPLVAIALLLTSGHSAVQLAAVPLIVVLLLMDSLDGYVARRRNEQTLAGGMLDVAADRAVEIVLWVVYAHLRLIPVVIPLVVAARGALTDSVRSVALQHGLSPHSMMRSPLGHWLVASGLVRTGYGVTKWAAFPLLALALAWRTGGHTTWHTVRAVGVATAWAALAFCIARGLPVLIEAPALFRSADFRNKTSSSPPPAGGPALSVAEGIEGGLLP
jgi:CDP-diacylglycerol--glycerol-3-phosphate 3-phosphatidyltransferase